MDWIGYAIAGVCTIDVEDAMKAAEKAQKAYKDFCEKVTAQQVSK